MTNNGKCKLHFFFYVVVRIPSLLVDTYLYIIQCSNMHLRSAYTYTLIYMTPYKKLNVTFFAIDG